MLVADELTPSVIAQLDWQRLAALVTDAGSWTYHTAILARSIHVPAVAGLHNASAVIRAGRAARRRRRDRRSVRRSRRRRRCSRSRARQRRRAAYEQSLDEYRPLPPVTDDGVADPARGQHRDRQTTPAGRGSGAPTASGCSDPSSCSPAADRRALTEEAQYVAYRRLIESMAPGPRDRSAPSTSARRSCRIEHAGVDGARAPLGLRGIRLSLALDDIFQAQLRALLRAAAHGPLRIMFPFVSGLEELRAARAAVARAAETLRARGAFGARQSRSAS